MRSSAGTLTEEARGWMVPWEGQSLKWELPNKQIVSGQQVVVMFFAAVAVVVGEEEGLVVAAVFVVAEEVVGRGQ